LKSFEIFQGLKSNYFFTGAKIKTRHKPFLLFALLGWFMLILKMLELLLL
jgi:hypothetical protein